MTIKKIKIFNIFFLFFLSFIYHNIYKYFPFDIIAIFFPVNESIWEHMKIIYFTLLTSSILEYFIYKRYNLNINNFNISMMVKSTAGVIIYLCLFIPIYKVFGKVFILSILLMLLIYILMEYISYKILKSDDVNIKVLPLIIIVLNIILFLILTFYPLHNFLFFDYLKFGYGILK